MNTNNLNLANGKFTVNGNIIFYFYSNKKLSNYITGAGIVLWPGTGTSIWTYCYGLGMNVGQFFYNVPTD